MKIIRILFFLIWLGTLIVLILTLTGLWANNPLENYKLLIGIAFIAITGVLKALFFKKKKAATSNK